MNEDDVDQDGGGMPDPATEARARKLGWVPKEEWGGDEADWVPAADFLARIGSNPTMLAERIDDMERRVEEKWIGTVNGLKTEIAETKKVLGDIHRRFKGADRSAYDRTRERAEREMEEAVAEADTEKYRAAKARLDALGAPPEPDPDPEPQPAPSKPNGGGQKSDPAVDAWMTKNPWFNSDLMLTTIAVEISKVIGKEQPGLTVAQNLEEVTREIKARFPEKFENPRRSAPGAVGRPSGDRGGGGKKGLRLEDLPKEDQETYRRMAQTMKARRGVEYTVAEFLKDYETA